MPVQLEAMADEAEAENDLIDPDTEEETVEQAAPTGDDPIRIVMDRMFLLCCPHCAEIRHSIERSRLSNGRR